MSRFLIEESSLAQFFGELPILNADLDLTRRCNLRCAHCFISGVETGRRELETHEFKRVIDQLLDLGTIEITFGGGEPFLRRDAPELIAYASVRGITCRIVTNGTLLSSIIVSALKDLRISVLQVSLDGDEKTHDWFRDSIGSFSAAVQGAELVAEAALPLVINTVVTVENRGSLNDLLPTIRYLSPQVWRLVPTLHAAGRATHGKIHPLSVRDINVLVSWVLKIRHTLEPKVSIVLPPAFLPDGDRNEEPGCNLLVQCGVMADGTVVPCIGFSPVREFYAGNVRTALLRDIWRRSSVFEKLRSSLREPPKGLCGECGFYNICRAFCRAQSYALYERIDAPMPICQSSVGI